MPDTLPTPAEALDKLATEGSPEQIAAFLLDRGLVGKHDVQSCPVARYVATTSVETIAVSGDGVWEWTSPGHPHDDGDPKVLPAAIVAFVSQFDQGKFPALETEPPHVPF